MTDIEKAKVIRLREAGRSYSEIKNETGLSEGAIKTTILGRNSSRYSVAMRSWPYVGFLISFCGRLGQAIAFWNNTE